MGSGAGDLDDSGKRGTKKKRRGKLTGVAAASTGAHHDVRFSILGALESRDRRRRCIDGDGQSAVLDGQRHFLSGHARDCIVIKKITVDARLH